MAHIHIAAANEDPEEMLTAVRELGAEKVIFLTWGEQEPQRQAEAVLDPLGIATEHRTVEGGMLTGTLATVQDIAAKHRDRHEDLLVNLGGADRYQSCSLLTAAFVAGLRAFDTPKGRVQPLPTLNFSYNEVVGKEQHEILQGLDKLSDDGTDLNTLAANTQLDSSTISYHIRGGEDDRGLEELGLIELRTEPGEGVMIHLTPIGETLARSMRFSPDIAPMSDEGPREP